MSSPSAPNDLILFHYPFSPYARRVTWYLALRGISYGQCIQPHILPRPDLAALGVHYRRIPLLSHAGDIYCDSRLILDALDRIFPPSDAHPSLFPAPATVVQMNPPASYDSTISLPSSKLPTTTPSASTTPPHRPLPTPSLLPHLLTRWTTDTGIMARSAQLIPPTSPLLLAPSFQSDRALFSGRALWTPEIIARGRPEALVVIRHAFHVLETLVLGDGREWVDGGVGRGGPGRADIEAVWTVHWVLGMEGAVPGDVFGRNVFPRVWAWVGRFDEAVRAAKRKGEKPGTLTGVEAKGVILGCEDAVEREGDVVDPLDPLGLRKGDVVEVFPTDSGFGHKDTGRLLKLDMEEVVIAVATPEGGKEVRVHMPRWGFRVKKVDAGARL